MKSEVETSKLTEVLLNTGTSSLKKYKDNYIANIENLAFNDYFISVLQTKHIKKSEAIANSGLELHYAYQILSGLKKPSRSKIICLCIGGGFTLSETNRALERAYVGKLYPKRLQDAVIILALNSGVNTVCKLNEMLSENEAELLG